MTKPKPKTADLLDELANVHRTYPPNTFELRRIARAAESLRNSDLGGYFEVLGAVAAAEGNGDKVAEYYEKAQNARLLDPESTNNFALSFLISGDHRFAEVAQHALSTYPHNYGIVCSVARLFAEAGMLEAAARANAMRPELARTLNLSPSEIAEADFDAAEHRHMAAAIPKAGLSEQDVAEVIVFARNVARDHGFVRPPYEIRLSNIFNEGEKALVYTIEVEAPLTQIEDLKRDLFTKLVEHDFPAESSGFLTVTVRSPTGTLRTERVAATA